jgi:hypothetical protein
MDLGSKGLKVVFHVFIDGFHFGLYGGIDGGIEGKYWIDCLISVWFLEISDDRALMWFQVLGCGFGPWWREATRMGLVGPHRKKGLLVKGTTVISAKRGIQWDRSQIRVS